MIIKIQKIVLFVILSFCFNAKISYAQNFAIIDTEKVIKEAKAVVYIQKIINEKQAQYQEIITQKEEKLKKEKDSLIAKKDLLSQKAFADEEKLLQDKIDEFKQFVIEKQNVLKEALQDSMKIVQEKIEESISEIAQEKKYTIIFPESQLVYFDENSDITNQVLESVNKKITKVKVKFGN